MVSTIEAYDVLHELEATRVYLPGLDQLSAKQPCPYGPKP